jgi:hypothetical protein
MMAVAQFIREHRGTVARTMREAFSVGLSDLGGALSWGEAKLLIEQAAADPSTALGAELAGWAYPATIPQLLGLIAQFAQFDKDARVHAMPWSMRADTKPTDDEIAAAQAELEDVIVFS